MDLPDLKNIFESKSVVIAKWLMSWIEHDLACGKISINNILPSKAEFAYLLGVSIGTMQNSFRYIEDLGYVESKQCIGTLVKNAENKTSTIHLHVQLQRLLVFQLTQQGLLLNIWQLKKLSDISLKILTNMVGFWKV